MRAEEIGTYGLETKEATSRYDLCLKCATSRPRHFDEISRSFSQGRLTKVPQFS